MSDVQWLSADEQRVWRSYLAATTTLREHCDRQLTKDAGIPHTYYEILVGLSEAPNRSMRMSDLADYCRSSRSKLSHAITRLERRKWVTRGGCEIDRRSSYATLTDLGFAAIDEAAPGHVATVRKHLFDTLSPAQVRALGEISDAIQAGFQEVCTRVRAEEDAADEGR